MKILIIQTAFIGDVILATPLVESLKASYPDSTIDFLLRKGNESLLSNHPLIREVIVFDKRKAKYRNLLWLIMRIREQSYDYVINVQRFFTTGLITALSGAGHRIGFDKNPLSFLFSESVKHTLNTESIATHEVDRNLALIQTLVEKTVRRPRLYPSDEDYGRVACDQPYICIAPASVWFTKQFPASHWAELIRIVAGKYKIYLIGSKDDRALCDQILEMSGKEVTILAGELSFLQSAALIGRARMTFANDSAPLHLASAMNAPVSAVFCSTVPGFGFGPLSDSSYIFEVEEKLDCRPCGLHGKESCPLGHFRCSDIDVTRMVTQTGL